MTHKTEGSAIFKLTPKKVNGPGKGRLENLVKHPSVLIKPLAELKICQARNQGLWESKQTC